jgi:ATP-dependent DNA helicase PIF1
MSHKSNIEALDKMLQDILERPVLFGGITVVFGGDFRQILPVIPKGTRASTFNACLKKSIIWENIETLKLSSNMRMVHQDDIHYANFILKIGEGTQPEINGMVELPQNSVIHSTEDLIRFVYPDFEERGSQPTYLSERAILAVTNSDVDALNDKVIKMLAGEMRVYLSSDSLYQTDGLNASLYPPEFLNTLNGSGLPPHKLVLQVGCPVMLLRNLDPSCGLCNGSRLMITNLKTHVLECVIISGKYAGQVVFIPRIDFIPDNDLPFSFKRRQFPVRVCYAMTVNKSQGQTLFMAGLYLRREVFSHGQLYVGLSRIKRSTNLRIYIDVEKSNFTRNIVYNEVL